MISGLLLTSAPRSSEKKANFLPSLASSLLTRSYSVWTSGSVMFAEKERLAYKEMFSIFCSNSSNSLKHVCSSRALSKVILPRYFFSNVSAEVEASLNASSTDGSFRLGKSGVKSHVFSCLESVTVCSSSTLVVVRFILPFAKGCIFRLFGKA